MGAINQAFNQAAGAVAGAALAIKHAKETEESKMHTAENSALVARNQARAAEAEANAANDEAVGKGGLTEQMALADLNKEKAEKAYDKAKNRKNGSIKTRLKKFDDLQAAQEAAFALKNKYKAIVDINNRATEQRIFAAKATKIALDAQQKFEKHWGGK